MLPVGPRLAPIDRAGLIAGAFAAKRDMLAVALHSQLLQISRKSLQILLIGQNSDGLRAEKVGVPDRQQAKQNGEIPLEWRAAEVLVHLVEPIQHGAEIRAANGKHRGEADGG